MALFLLRFSSPPLARTSSGNVLRRSDNLMRSSGRASTVPLRVDRLARLSFTLQLSTGNFAISTSSVLNCSKSDGIQLAELKDCHYFAQNVLGYHPILAKNISALQKAAICNFGKALIVANSMMLVPPPWALAETCEPHNSFSNMPLLFAIAMIGAVVGGLLARQRKAELKRLNEQLRQINAALRRQAKIESYAPTLSYAPVGTKLAESEVIVDPQKERVVGHLRTGKNYLRNQAPEKAFPEFKDALDLAKSLGDHVEEKKAARGLGASLQRQGKYKEAIKYHSMVLDISNRTGEDAGVTEAYGAIADCYTELGELEKAGKFYDSYIARLENE